MLRPIIALLTGLAIAIYLAASTGCSGGGGGVIDELCDRADECNILDGVSHGECVEYMDQCTGDLTRSQREQWEDEIAECMESRTCDAAIDCYNQVPWC